MKNIMKAKRVINLDSEGRYFVSVGIFEDKMTLFYSFAVAGFIQQQGCCTKIAIKLETYLSTHSVPLFILSLSEMLFCIHDFVLWDFNDIALRRSMGWGGDKKRQKSKTCMLRSLPEFCVPI